MKDFFVSPLFFAILAGFLATYLYQVFFKAGQEQNDLKSQEYVDRLTPENLAQMKSALGEGNKIEAIKVLRAGAEIGLKEANRVVKYLKRTNSS